jgi:serine/threonine protein kinase
MEQTTFLGHYRISVDDSTAPRELGRAGAATTYKAVDERSGEPVALTLIPVSSIDPAARNQFEEQARAAARIKHINIAKVLDFGREEDHFVYISEPLPGEPLASWIEQHGPMPADAVLRVAEQIVSVLSTARFHKLAQCAIQPANLVIVPGSTPEGSWPFVKLTNFGLAELDFGPKSSTRDESVKLMDFRDAGSLAGGLDKPNGSECEEISVAPQFASPEPRKVSEQHQTADFRSEVYSLGATMYFMLTAGAPPPETRRARELSGFPKALRNLIGSMLHRDPDQRPKDPVALAEMIRECLLKIERRQVFARRLGIPQPAVIPRKSRTTLTPLAQVLRATLVFAAIVLAAGVLGALLLPVDINPFRHRTTAKEMIGVPIGVPEASPFSSPQATKTAPVVANQPPTDTVTSGAADQTSSPGPEQGQSSNAGLVAAASPASPPEPRPNAPASGGGNYAQVQDTAAAQSNAASQPATASEATSSGKKKSVAAPASKRTGVAQKSADGQRRRTGSMRARVVGITSDGRLLFRSSSGRTVIVTPGAEDEDELAPSRRRRDARPQVRDEFSTPSRSFPPDYSPDD